MTFEEKVRNDNTLQGCYKEGLQALRRRDRKKIRCEDTRLLNGSIYLEKCVKGGRWDYLLGYREEAYFVEVHPAESTEVKVVLAKLDWLKRWQADTPFRSDRRYFWIPSDGVHISPRARYWKDIALSGIKIVRALELK